jgi:hypothetical protein
MENRLNVVAVWVEHERAVVAWVIGTLARSAVVSAARSESGLMKGVHSFLIRCLEGEVYPGRVVGGLTHEEFIGIEKAGSLLKYVGQSESLENDQIEALHGQRVCLGGIE